MDVEAAKMLGGHCRYCADGCGCWYWQHLLDPGRLSLHPAARDQVFGIGMLGFALTEAVALFALLIAFIILFA